MMISSKEIANKAGLGSNFHQAPEDLIIRAYRKEDREAIRKICCETGFLGDLIDPIFEDRKVFADFLTRYYTDFEPQGTFVAERESGVVGYITSSQSTRRHTVFFLWIILVIALRVIFRYVFRIYNKNTRDYIWWLLTRGRKETPLTVKGAAHFHINLLPSARTGAIAVKLVETLFAQLKKDKVKKIYGQMVTSGNRRRDRLYTGLGWKVLDRKEISKFREHTDLRVELVTIYREL